MQEKEITVSKKLEEEKKDISPENAIKQIPIETKGIEREREKEREEPIETARFPEEKKEKVEKNKKYENVEKQEIKKSTITHILEDLDRPILEFDDTKARMQNMAIIGANIENNKLKTEENECGDCTPRQIDIDDVNEHNLHKQTESIQLEIVSETARDPIENPEKNKSQLSFSVHDSPLSKNGEFSLKLSVDQEKKSGINMSLPKIGSQRK